MISTPPKKYMAASVPRFLRQTRLGYLPLDCLIGSRHVTGDNGAHLIFDIVMLPEKQFHLMRLNVGLQHVSALDLKAGPAFEPAFILTDTKVLMVSGDEPNPDSFARTYFQIEFGFITPPPPPPPPPVPFPVVARECAKRLPKSPHPAELAEAAVNGAENGENDPSEKAADKQG